MRKQILAGNWKMNKNIFEAIELSENLSTKVEQMQYDESMFKIIIAPPFTHLYAIKSVLNKKIELSAQNIAQWEKGAYTGEISAEMVKSLGINYTIIGHSERRQYFSENSSSLFSKVQIALKNELIPIFCIGENLQERDSNKHFQVVEQQLNDTLFLLSIADFQKVIIAYEPVWAIGTGKNATPDQAQEIHAFIRQLITKKFDHQTADNTSILYGGSCNPANGKSLFEKSDIDGGLIGGASLKSDDFINLLEQLIISK